MKPTSWGAYNAKLKRASSVKHPKLNVFATRFALARGLPTVEFDGFTPDTSDGYAAALRVAFAYTALESLEAALGEKGRLLIASKSLADELRDQKHAKFLAALLGHHGVQDGLRKNMHAFAIGADDNLRWIAYAVRNLMFHGSLTAAGLQLGGSKRRRSLLNELADAILEAVDERFTKYVRRLH